MLIKVTPNSKTFSLQLKNGAWTARVPAKAQDNAANAELLKQLSTLTKTRVHLLAGAKSREKTVSADGLTDAQLNDIFTNAQKH